MARKKTAEPQEPNTEVVEAPITAETETPEVEAEKPTVEPEVIPVEKEKPVAPKKAEPEMSDDVKAILKTFSDHKELWISKFGGVYTSKPSTSVEAILFKNPYFKS